MRSRVGFVSYARCHNRGERGGGECGSQLGSDSLACLASPEQKSPLATARLKQTNKTSQSASCRMPSLSKSGPMLSISTSSSSSNGINVRFSSLAYNSSMYFRHLSVTSSESVSLSSTLTGYISLFLAPTIFLVNLFYFCIVH